jgi:hypothetical protein
MALASHWLEELQILQWRILSLTNPAMVEISKIPAAE